MKKLAKVVAVFALSVPLAVAQQTRVYGGDGNWTQEITGSLAAVRNLRVKVDVGSVRVSGGSEQGISYIIRTRSFSSAEAKAHREFDSYKINTYVRGDTAWISGDWEGGRPRRFSADFSINVPRTMDDVKIETEGGNVEIAGITGRVNTQSGGGSIRLDDLGGEADAETGGGSIDVGTVGADINLRTGGGSIKVRSAKGKVVAETGGGSVLVISCGQEAELETGGGGIQVEHAGGRVKASTGGGSIDLGDVGAAAELETGGGSIRLNSAKGFVHADTGGGSIELNGVPAARAETGSGGITARFVPGGTGEHNDSELETSAGDIVVYLSPSVNINVRASIEDANGHNIRSEFPEIRVTTEGGEYGPKAVTADGKLNAGGSVLRVRTETGDIEFRRSSR